MICPNCNAQIPDNSSFCPLCGASISVQIEANFISVPCPYCGAANENDAQFCINCGKDMWNQSSNKSSKRKLILIAAISLILLAVVTVFLVVWMNGKNEPETRKSTAETSQPKQESAQSNEKAAHQNLQASIKEYLKKSGVNSSASVYYTDLSDGEEFSHNSHSMRAAQSGRIFVLEYIMQALRDGKMSRSEELMRTIRKTASGDEPSSHKLVEMITGDFAAGLDLVSQYVKAKGYTDTLINRFNGDAGNHKVTTPNQTSVRDTGKCMMRIYKESTAGDDFAQEIMDILNTNASLKEGIARSAERLDKDIYNSNLESAYTECENDVALLSYDGHAVVVSVMIADLNEDDKEHQAALTNIQEISKRICETLLLKQPSNKN